MNRAILNFYAALNSMLQSTVKSSQFWRDNAMEQEKKKCK